jgi:hypothetical protein
VPAPRVTSSRVVYENHRMRLHEDRLGRADDSPGLYAWVQKPPGALIVPLDEAAEGDAGDEPPRARQNHVWLETGLEPGPRTSEPTEQDLRCACFPIAEFDAMIRRGEVADAATVAGWHLVSRR